MGRACATWYDSTLHEIRTARFLFACLKIRELQLLIYWWTKSIYVHGVDEACPVQGLGLNECVLIFGITACSDMGVHMSCNRSCQSWHIHAMYLRCEPVHVTCRSRICTLLSRNSPFHLDMALYVAFKAMAYTKGLQILVLYHQACVLCFTSHMMGSSSDPPKDLKLTGNQICNPFAKPSNLEVVVMCHLSSPKSPLVQHCTSGHRAPWERPILIR